MEKSVPRVHNYALKIPWAQVGRGAQLRHAPRRGLNRTRGCRFFNFLLLSGLHPSEGLFGSSIAAQTMQDPGRQTSHAALWNSQVVSVMSGIPVLNTIPRPAPGQDILNSPNIFLLIALLVSFGFDK